jgi:hypothetical protein
MDALNPVAILKEVDLRTTQMLLASNIGKPSAKRRADFLTSEIERLRDLACEAIKVHE